MADAEVVSFMVGCMLFKLNQIFMVGCSTNKNAHTKKPKSLSFTSYINNNWKNNNYHDNTNKNNNDNTLFIILC